jgi:hypothetical protein
MGYVHHSSELGLSGSAGLNAMSSRHAIAGFKVVVERARADIPKLKADLKAIKDDLYANCDKFTRPSRKWQTRMVQVHVPQASSDASLTHNHSQL